MPASMCYSSKLKTEAVISSETSENLIPFKANFEPKTMDAVKKDEGQNANA
jgi:hypothetical protein